MMKPKVLMDGNWVKVQREHIGMGEDLVITIQTKGQPNLPLIVFSEDEWKEVQRAAAHDDPKDWSS